MAAKNFIFGSIAGLLVFWLGWVCASSRIATECRRLGGFYVGNTTYTCTATKTDDRRQWGPTPPPPLPPRAPPK